MAIYRHQNTGLKGEILDTKDNTVVLRLTDTGETKEVNTATFKRWWKQVDEPVVAVNPVNDDAVEAVIVNELVLEKTEREVAVLKLAKTEIPSPAEEKATPLSDVIAKLEDLYQILNRQYFDNTLPMAMITVQTSPKAFGSCSTKKIWKTGLGAADSGLYEINIGAEFINAPSELVAGTMLHEMVHLYCIENHIEETCQGGRYHNKLFKEECEKRDLQVDYNRTTGHSATRPTEAFTGVLKANNYKLESKFARHTNPEAKEKKASRNKSHKYECLICKQSFRTTQELSLTCAICEEPMSRFD